MVDPEALPELEDADVVRARVRDALSDIARVVAVASGKGGVGKSAVAVNLALALSQRGERTALLDADLHGPSVAKMLGLRGQPVRVGSDERLLPAAGPAGVAVQSFDFFLEGNLAPDWDGPRAEGATLRSAMEEAVLLDLLGRTAWGPRDVLVIDLPPGADRLPALFRWLPPQASALVVTIPTQVSLLAVERALRRARAARIPLAGLVENFGSVTCAKCGADGPLYPEGGVDRLARDLAVEVVARVPFEPRLARAADLGESFLEGAGQATSAGRAIVGLAERLATLHHAAMQGDSW